MSTEYITSYKTRILKDDVGNKDQQKNENRRLGFIKSLRIQLSSL